MSPPPFRLEPLGDRALLAVLGEGIDGDLNDRVHTLAAALKGLPGLTDLVPAYASLAVHYEPLAFREPGSPPHAAVARRIREAWESLRERAPGPARQVEIPVRYGGEAGPDLEEVARHCGLDPAEVVARHAAADYRVFMLGFAPGFPYLGGLDPALATPRHPTPRKRVPAGSVGIAGPQTGIYPLDTPGGWQIIGRTPLRLFDPALPEPCLLAPGDRLRFVVLP